MDHWGVESEAELITGHILRLGKEFRQGRSGGGGGAEIREKVALEVFHLRQRFRERFVEQVSAEGLSERDQRAAAERRASAWCASSPHRAPGSLCARPGSCAPLLLCRRIVSPLRARVPR